MAAFLDVTITDAGKAAAFNAESTGIELELTDVAFGSLTKVPDGSETSLVGEIKRVAIDGGARVATDQIRVWGLWTSDTDEGDIREIGIYAGDTLFAYYSRADGGVIGRKVAGGDFVFYYDFKLAEIPSDSVNVVFDPESSVALMIMRVHEADMMAHSQYLRRAEVAQEGSVFRWGGVADGTSDVIELTLPTESLLTSYQPGQTFKFVSRYANTGSVAMRINGLELRSVRKNGSTALVAGDIARNRVYEVTFDGSNFQIHGSVGIADEGEETPDGEVFYVYEFIAEAGQTEFEAPYNLGALEVFYAGDIVPPARFTAEDGATVTLAPCEEGKEVVIITFQQVAASNVYTKQETYKRSEIANLLNEKQADLGFVPVQQGGGVGQLDNKVRIGWGANGLLAQVDNQQLGNLWYAGNFNPATKATAPNVREIDQTSSLDTDDVGLVLINSAAAAITVTLPGASTGIYDFVVRRTDNSGNRLVVQSIGTDRIMFHTHLSAVGYPFLVLMGAGDWWHLRSDGMGRWWPIGRCDGTPLGRVGMDSSTTISPGGYGVPSGTLYSRAEWPWLWDHAQQSGALVSDANRLGREGGWTTGDGSSTFRGPELRGEFIRILDESRAIDIGRAQGTSQAMSMESHSHIVSYNSWTPKGVDAGPGTGVEFEPLGPLNYPGENNRTTSTAGGTETRPRNIAFAGRLKLI